MKVVCLFQSRIWQLIGKDNQMTCYAILLSEILIRNFRNVQVGDSCLKQSNIVVNANKYIKYSSYCLLCAIPRYEWIDEWIDFDIRIIIIFYKNRNGRHFDLSEIVGLCLSQYPIYIVKCYKNTCRYIRNCIYDNKLYFIAFQMYRYWQLRIVF